MGPGRARMFVLRAFLGVLDQGLSKMTQRAVRSRWAVFATGQVSRETRRSPVSRETGSGQASLAESSETAADAGEEEDGQTEAQHQKAEGDRRRDPRHLPRKQRHPDHGAVLGEAGAHVGHWLRRRVHRQSKAALREM